jgi:Ferritin-like domain
MRGGAVPRALLALTAGLALALALGSCGGEGETSAEEEKAADVEILNEVLGRQLSAVAAYDEVLPGLRGPALAAARQFRAQEQEHVDAIVKALRGIGGEADPDPEEIDTAELKTEEDRLLFLYELESETIEDELDAIPNLNDGWPRKLFAMTAANQAQHLVLLRRALGAKGGEIVPEPFEYGQTPVP